MPILEALGNRPRSSSPGPLLGPQSSQGKPDRSFPATRPWRGHTSPKEPLRLEMRLVNCMCELGEWPLQKAQGQRVGLGCREAAGKPRITPKISPTAPWEWRGDAQVTSQTPITATNVPRTVGLGTPRAA